MADQNNELQDDDDPVLAQARAEGKKARRPKVDEDDDEGETVQLDMFGEGEEAEVEDTEDGGAIVRLQGEERKAKMLEHFANIIDDIPPSALTKVISDLVTKLERDKEARAKRDKLYEEGLRRTGLGDDAPGGAQFTGANKVVHPMLIEACVDFSAWVMKELFPANGPVKSKVHGISDKKKLEKAQRKAEFMNWQTTEQMPEFRGELEQLSTQLPLGGGQYLKMNWSKQSQRPAVEFVAIDDILLPFAATNFYTAERKTHVQYITEQEYRARIKAGMYIDVDLPSPEEPEFSKAEQANMKIEGKEASSYNEDGLRTIFEISCLLDIEEEDDFKPYMLTVDKTTSRGLSLYRNWEEDDKLTRELDWIVEFPFVPWRGAYPIGLTHMIGGLSGAATGSLRALLDSAHIQNIPTLLKLKGGPNGQTLNLQPTEVAEIEGGAMVDDIRKLIMAVPFNGPSPTLFQLLGFLVDAGKGVVQTSFEKLSESNPNMPVGTTVALIEQGMVVYSSIFARMHNSMGRVFKILHRINSAYLTEEILEAQCSHLDVEPEDFDAPMDVVPVSDPAIFSETQRFAQVQAILQRSAVAPQMYDPRKVEEMFLRAMKVSDDVLQPAQGKEDMDPVSENVAASMSRPIYVLPKQDHMAHIRVHMQFLESPVFGQNPIIIRQFLYPMSGHLRDHLLNYYLTEAHRVVEEGTQEGLIPEDAMVQAQVIQRTQMFLEQRLGQFAQKLAAIDQAAQQFRPQPPMPPDSSMQIAQLGAQLKGQELAQRQQSEQQKLGFQQQSEQQKLADAERDRQAELEREKLRQDAENARTTQTDTIRYRMNVEDNQTALQLAELEVATGEKFSVSTGTGINPGV